MLVDSQSRGSGVYTDNHHQFILVACTSEEVGQSIRSASGIGAGVVEQLRYGWSDVQQPALVGTLLLQVCCGRLIPRDGKAGLPDQTHKGVKGLKREGPKSIGPVGRREYI